MNTKDVQNLHTCFVCVCVIQKFMHIFNIYALYLFNFFILVTCALVREFLLGTQGPHYISPAIFCCTKMEQIIIHYFFAFTLI